VTFRGDDRAASATVSHAVTIGITALLLTGLFISAGDLFERQQKQTGREQLEAVGGKLAGQIQRVDSLGDAGRDVRATLRTSYPSSVAGEPYTVHLVPADGNATLYVNSTQLDVRRSFVVVNETRVEPARVTGGTIRVALRSDGTGEYLTLTN
jgi:hypothetical protein